LIVLDASAVISALLNAGPARHIAESEQLHAPHLVDSEVANGLRRLVRSGRLRPEQGWEALNTLRRLGMTRYAVSPLIDRVWELRDTLSAYDASYVALAEALQCNLVTADDRLARASDLQSPVIVVPR
jgi:predicted nucleic acid-binding protein